MSGHPGHKSGDKYLPAGGRRWPSAEEKWPWNFYEKRLQISCWRGLNQPKICVFLNRFVPFYRESAVTLPSLHTKHNLQLAALSVCSEEMNISSWQKQPGRKQHRTVLMSTALGCFAAPPPTLHLCQRVQRERQHRLTQNTALILAHLAMLWVRYDSDLETNYLLRFYH